MSGYVQLSGLNVQVPTYANVASFPAAGIAGRMGFSIDTAMVLFDDGSTWTAFTAATAVTASANYGTDNVLLRADGVNKGTQASTITVSDAGAVSGITSLALTGAISGGTNITLSGTVDGRDVSVDGIALDAVVITASTAILDADIASDGIMARTAAATYAARTITGTANQVVVSNGGGVAGNPTLSLPQSIHTAATPAFASLTLSNKVFVTAIATATASNAGTTVIGASTLVQLLNPDAATVAAHTVTLPASPANGQLIYVANAHATNTVTALTIDAGGDTVIGGLTALGVGANICLVYVTATTTWVRIA